MSYIVYSSFPDAQTAVASIDGHIQHIRLPLLPTSLSPIWQSLVELSHFLPLDEDDVKTLQMEQARYDSQFYRVIYALVETREEVIGHSHKLFSPIDDTVLGYTHAQCA